MKQAEQDLLVLAAQSGNHRALNLLYRHFYQAQLRFAYQLCKDQPMAQDAVQEVWIKTARSLKSLRDPRAFRSWLYRSTRRQTIDLIRQQQRKQRYLSDVDVDTLRSNEPTRLTRQQQLREQINQLPKADQQVLFLFYLEGLRVAEIALALDVLPSTVKTRLYRARERLRQVIQQ